MIAAIVAATIAARNQQQRGGVNYPAKRKISKWLWTLYALDILGLLTIIVLIGLGT